MSIKVLKGFKKKEKEKDEIKPIELELPKNLMEIKPVKPIEPEPPPKDLVKPVEPIVLKELRESDILAVLRDFGITKEKVLEKFNEIEDVEKKLVQELQEVQKRLQELQEKLEEVRRKKASYKILLESVG
ncbi:MAG: hypothetical protein DRJ52_09615 [Thermoprotei archaeon]|nr:MAG: hypothetical protein DRJ52_09615 [Thermoprotei archaeon]